MNLKACLPRTARIFLLAGSISGLLFTSPALSAPATDQENAVAQAISRVYDTAQAKVHSRPVSISGSYAVAAWQQGEKAGRALLKQEKDGWQIMLCAGEQLRTVKGLREAGLPAATAKDLQSKIEHAERALTPALRAKLDAFAQVKHTATPQSHPDSHHPH